MGLDNKKAYHTDDDCHDDGSHPSGMQSRPLCVKTQLLLLAHAVLKVEHTLAFGQHLPPLLVKLLLQLLGFTLRLAHQLERLGYVLIFDLPGVELYGLPRVAQQEGSMLGCDFNRLHRLGYHLLRFFLDSILEIVVKLLVALFQLYPRCLHAVMVFHQVAQLVLVFYDLLLVTVVHCSQFIVQLILQVAEFPAQAHVFFAQVLHLPPYVLPTRGIAGNGR